MKLQVAGATHNFEQANRDYSHIVREFFSEFCQITDIIHTLIRNGRRIFRDGLIAVSFVCHGREHDEQFLFPEIVGSLSSSETSTMNCPFLYSPRCGEDNQSRFLAAARYSFATCTTSSRPMRKG